MFVTARIYCLLAESSQETNVTHLLRYMDRLLEFKDHNWPRGTPLFGYWAQKPSSGGRWVRTAENLVGVLQRMHDVGDWMGLIPQRVLEIPQNLQLYTRIPSDFDDTAMFFELGAVLKQNRLTLSEQYAQFLNQQFDLTKIGDIMWQYAYEPFSSDVRRSVMDTRSYFWLHRYLDRARQEGRNNVTLITTWACSWTEGLEQDQVKIPFHTNNVDATVWASVLSVANSVVVTKLDDPTAVLSPRFKQLLSESVQALLYAFTSRIVFRRPELVSPYYTDIYQIIWQCSRAIRWLKKAPERFDEFPWLRVLSQDVLHVLKKTATNQLLSKAICNGSECYWQSFLGQNDKGSSVDGDKVGCTAITLHALLNIWTTPGAFGTKKRRQWDGDMSLRAREVIHKSRNWLLGITAEQLSASEMCMFNGGLTGNFDLPYAFPGNFARWKNGSDLMRVSGTAEYPYIALDILFGNLTYGVRGVMGKKDFLRSLRTIQFQTWFPPLLPRGLNAKPFPFWSSTAFIIAVYRAAMLGMEQMA